MAEPVTLASISAAISSGINSTLYSIAHYDLSIAVPIIAFIAFWICVGLLNLFVFQPILEWLNGVTKRQEQRIAAREAAKRAAK